MRIITAIGAAGLVFSVYGQPQIRNEGSNVVIQAGPGGDVAFQTGGTPQNLSSMLARLTALESRVADLESNTLPTNVTRVQYQSNMDQTAAQNAGLNNDISFLVGQFSTTQSLQISVEDRGACSSFSMRFTLVANWGLGIGNKPQIYSAGAADARRHSLVQWYFRPINNNTYILWLYLPPWPLCGGNGQAPGNTHTLTISTQASSQHQQMSFTPTNAGVFDWYGANRSNIQPIATQIHAVAADVLPLVNQEINRAQIQTQWTSNMDSAWAAGQGVSNDLRLLVGKFSVTSVVTVSVSNRGSCSTIAQDFTVVSRWGVHLAANAPTSDPTRYHPEVFSFGIASDWSAHINGFQWYFAANGTDMYFLYLYMPPLPTCGQDGRTPMVHRTTVTVQSSEPVSQTWAGPRRATFNNPPGIVLGAPIFDFPEVGNLSGIFSIATQTIASSGNTEAISDALNSAVDRFTTTVRWNSNMDPNWAASNGQVNTLSKYLGRMSVNSVVTLSLSDSGWCSGTAIEFKIMGRWGIHYQNYTSTSSRANDTTYAPVAYAIGQAQGTFGAGQSASQIFHLFFSPVPSASGSVQHLYNLFLHIPAFPTCGSRGPAGLGTVPREHTTTITLTVDGRGDQAVLNGTTQDNDGGSVAFDWYSVNNTNIRPIQQRVIDPVGSDLFKAMISQSINRKQSSFTYSSNMNPTYASQNGQTNSLSAVLGLFSTTSVMEILVEDAGMCSGVGMKFTLVGRWGVNRATSASTGEAFHPEIFTYGSASEWLFNPARPSTQAFQFYFTAARDAQNRVRADQFYLWLYIPPWSTCGRPGTTPSTHTATVTMTISRAPATGGLSYDQMFNPTGAPPFDYFGANSSQITRIRSQVAAVMQV